MGVAPGLQGSLRTVRGEGIVLRPYTESDMSSLVALFTDPDTVRWNSGPTSLDDVRVWIEHQNDWSSGDHVSWAVSDDTGALLGTASLFKLDLHQRLAEIGYRTAPPARGRGVALAAVNAVVRAAFDTLRLHRLSLYHSVGNEASCRVALRAGFVQEGLLRQSWRYADDEYDDEHLHALLATDAASS